MRVLFDQGTPDPLRKLLPSHEIATVFACGWSTLSNGDLLAVAEENEFDVFITTDKNLRSQQNLSKRKIAIVVLPTTSWPRIRKAAVAINQTIENASPGNLYEVSIP